PDRLAFRSPGRPAHAACHRNCRAARACTGPRHYVGVRAVSVTDFLLAPPRRPISLRSLVGCAVLAIACWQAAETFTVRPAASAGVLLDAAAKMRMASAAIREAKITRGLLQ